MKEILPAAALLLCAPVVFAVPASCGSREDTVFACFTGHKQVAVCGSPGWAGARGSLQYRFGTARNADLVLPASAVPPSASARAGRVAFSGGGGAWLRFHGDGTEYVVYTAILRDAGEKSGVVVERAGRRLATLACRGKVTSRIGDDVFRQGGFEADTQDFDLPD